MPKQATKNADRKAPDSVESIAESKLSRVEMIAREALDILGEEAPEDLRRSVAEVRAQHEIELAELNGKLDTAGTRIEELTAQVRSAERLAEDRFAEAEEVWKLAHSHAADLASTSQQLDEACEEIELLRVTADSRARELDELKARHETLIGELQTANDEAAGLRSTIEAETTRRERVERALAEARDRIESLGTAMDAAAKNARERIETLETELAESRELAEERGERVATLETELTGARAQVEELEEANDERVERIESLTRDLTATRDELAERGSRLADAEQRSQEARETLAEVRTALEELTEERDEATAKLSQRTAETARARRELADLTQRLAERDRQLADLTENDGAAPPPVTAATDSAEIAEIRAELEARTTELAYLREQTDRADARADRYRDRAEAAERSLEKAAAIVRRARRRSSERNGQFGALVTRLTATRIRCENLEARAEAQAERIKRLTVTAIGTSVVAAASLLAAIVF